VPELEQRRRTVRVLELMTQSFEAHTRSDEAAFRSAADEAFGVDTTALVGIQGGIVIGEIPNPENDWPAWNEYVAAAQEELARLESDTEAWGGQIPPPGYGYAEWVEEGRADA
jgi:hypothetical protein